MAWFSALFVLSLLLGAGLTVHAAAEDEERDWKQSWPYFQKVDLSCESDSLAIQFVQFWILPSGEIRRPSSNDADHHVTLKNDGFGLSIDKLDDDDFGIYYCVVKTGRNMSDVIKIGINVDGPYYGDDLINRYKRSAIIGGIAAGAMLVVLVTIWLLCSNLACCKRTDKAGEAAGVTNGKGLPVTDTGQERDKLDGWHQATKIGDSIYDSADGLKPVRTIERQDSVPQGGGRHDERLLSSDSGHYQTIGSLERDQKLLSESEISDDVKILKTVIRRDWSETTDPGTNTGDVTNDTENEQSVDVGTESNEKDNLSSAPVDGFSNNITSSGSVMVDEVEYSVPAKRNRKNQETVVVIDGDVVLEPNGTSVIVTTVQSLSQTDSLPKDNIVKTPDLNENPAKIEQMVDTAVVPVVQSPVELNEKAEHGNAEISNIKNEYKTAVEGNDANRHHVSHSKTSDEPEAELTDTRKISSASTPKSEADSSGNSTVDEETVTKYQNVLASLISKHSRSNSGSAASVRGMGSRSTSADSNVFQEEVISDGAADHAVHDVRL